MYCIDLYNYIYIFPCSNTYESLIFSKSAAISLSCGSSSFVDIVSYSSCLIGTFCAVDITLTFVAMSLVNLAIDLHVWRRLWDARRSIRWWYLGLYLKLLCMRFFLQNFVLKLFDLDKDEGWKTECNGISGTVGDTILHCSCNDKSSSSDIRDGNVFWQRFFCRWCCGVTALDSVGIGMSLKSDLLENVERQCDIDRTTASCDIRKLSGRYMEI